MHGLFLAAASLVFLSYVLAPIAWLVSSSFQNEREIVSKPPHWIPDQPSLQNFTPCRVYFHQQFLSRSLHRPGNLDGFVQHFPCLRDLVQLGVRIATRAVPLRIEIFPSHRAR